MCLPQAHASTGDRLGARFLPQAFSLSELQCSETARSGPKTVPALGCTISWNILRQNHFEPLRTLGDLSDSFLVAEATGGSQPLNVPMQGVNSCWIRIMHCHYYCPVMYRVKIPTQEILVTRQFSELPASILVELSCRPDICAPYSENFSSLQRESIVRSFVARWKAWRIRSGWCDAAGDVLQRSALESNLVWFRYTPDFATIKKIIFSITIRNI